jgi:hypothetical protein
LTNPRNGGSVISNGNTPLGDETVAQVTIHTVRAVTAPGYPPCFEYYVYLGDKLIRVCPSIGMAQEVAAGL